MNKYLENLILKLDADKDLTDQERREIYDQERQEQEYMEDQERKNQEMERQQQQYYYDENGNCDGFPRT